MCTASDRHRSSFARSLSTIHLRGDSSSASSRRPPPRSSGLASAIRGGGSERPAPRRAGGSRRLAPEMRDLPPSPSDVMGVDPAPAARELCSGFRGDYSLGEAVRSPSHMMSDPPDDLQKHGFAFVKRTDGSYSYAILAYRPTRPAKGGSSGEGGDGVDECMTFVVDDEGSTKTIRRGHWGEMVRLVSMTR